MIFYNLVSVSKKLWIFQIEATFNTGTENFVVIADDSGISC
jgi:hypothetical protein